MTDASPFAMSEPPPADRVVDAATVRRALAEQFPELALESIEHLGTGWEHDVYVVDRRIVFRFPRYAEVAGNLDDDVAVHALVRARVGDALVVPEVRFEGKPGAAFPHRFVGHVLVPGVGADRVVPFSTTPPEHGASSAATGAVGSPRAALPSKALHARLPSPASAEPLASDLGRGLTAVHAIPADAAMAIGIGPADADCRPPFDALMRQVPLVPGLRDVVPSAVAWLYGTPTVPATYAGPPRFLHNGLHAEHIIVDPATRRLSGIVDWSSAALGDPSLDFSFLLLLGGPAFLDSALGTYGLSLDQAFAERVAFRAKVRALGWLAHALWRGLDTTRILDEVENAFAV